MIQWAKLVEKVIINEAAKENGLFATGISGSCKGTRKTCGGFIWKFKNKS